MQIEENGQERPQQFIGEIGLLFVFSNALAIIEAAKPHRGNLSHAFRMLTKA